MKSKGWNSKWDRNGNFLQLGDQNKIRMKKTRKKLTIESETLFENEIAWYSTTESVKVNKQQINFVIHNTKVKRVTRSDFDFRLADINVCVSETSKKIITCKVMNTLKMVGWHYWQNE